MTRKGMTVQDYLKNVGKRYEQGNATEHTYRGDLQTFIESLCPEIQATNEPQRQECGAPDFILTRKKIPVGYIEAKDIGANLDEIENDEQLTRYKASLNNLILTDYIRFYRFKNGKKVSIVNLGTIEKNKILINEKESNSFETFILDFCSSKNQTITSAESLAKMMANKAKLMQSIILNTVSKDDEKNTLRDQLEAFKKILIHDLTEQEFADIYAQTIAYGLFAARLHDKTPETFSREEALFLVPETNPFLRKLFTYVAGPDLDSRIVWIVDDLAEILLACDIKEILKDFGSMTHQKDPMIHFYETFLAEYNPALRKSRGVYYTPEPVVNFIIKSVDYILENDFKLSGGLSNTEKVPITIKGVQGKGSKSKETKEIHKVQILDPATGTGTFLSEAIKNIYSRFKNQKGVWSSYIENHLIPRLHGFELLMAPYTICHLKLELLLEELGYKPKKNERFKVYLTNSLEEAHPDTGTLFASWLSEEANEANHIKKDVPIMVVFGNPPYSVSSHNKGDWIEKLLEDYKKNLKEKNINPLSDDYIKFIRYAQYFIEKNGQGIMAMITNNSFIDGLIHRQMRTELLRVFNKIYILDLHGNSNRKETTLDGNKDENVFDIQQGVSINIFMKTSNGKKGNNAEVLQYDLFGKREEKYNFLLNNNINTVKFEKISINESHNFFVNKNFKNNDEYLKLISLSDIFTFQNTGINTEFDPLVICDKEKDAIKLLNDLKSKNSKEILEEYKLEHNKTNKVINAQNDLKKHSSTITKIDYRPFDTRYTIYTGHSNGVMGRPRNEIMKHMVNKKNIGLVSMRQYAYDVPYHCYSFVTNNIIDNRFFISNKGYCSLFPLNIFSDSTGQQTIESVSDNNLNLKLEFISKIEKSLNLNFTKEKLKKNDSFTAMHVFSYIYAVLYSPNYLKTYEEYLKIDFPRIPLPVNKKVFFDLCEKGSYLITLHLMENNSISKFDTSYPIEGKNIIDKIKFEKNRVYINKDQYFEKVSEIAWKLYIGGYQPAQKWLKDRKDKVLSYDDIIHYQRIIYVLSETNRTMNAIDKIIEF